MRQLQELMEKENERKENESGNDESDKQTIDERDNAELDEVMTIFFSGPEIFENLNFPPFLNLLIKPFLTVKLSKSLHIHQL